MPSEIQDNCNIIILHMDNSTINSNFYYGRRISRCDQPKHYLESCVLCNMSMEMKFGQF